MNRKGTLIAKGSKAGNLYRLKDTLTPAAFVAETEEFHPQQQNPILRIEAPNRGDNDEASDGGNDISGGNEATDEATMKLFRELHCRLGHPGLSIMKLLAKHVLGIPELKIPRGFFCDICETNKLTRHIRKYRYEKEVIPGARLSTDVWGPYRVRCEVPGIGDVSYYYSLVDEATGYS